jgi:hypothetical protein
VYKHVYLPSTSVLVSTRMAVVDPDTPLYTMISYQLGSCTPGDQSERSAGCLCCHRCVPPYHTATCCAPSGSPAPDRSPC